MDTGTIVDIVVNIVFWILVIYIAWNENSTPSWLYVVLFSFIIYFALRTIFQKEGMERVVWLYSLNMMVLVYLFYVFMTKRR